MTQVTFRPTASGKTPHQLVEEYFVQHLGDLGRVCAGLCYQTGMQFGTEAYDQSVLIVLKDIGKTPEDLLEHLQLNGN